MQSNLSEEGKSRVGMTASQLKRSQEDTLNPIPLRVPLKGTIRVPLKGTIKV